MQFAPLVLVTEKPDTAIPDSRSAEDSVVTDRDAATYCSQSCSQHLHDAGAECCMEAWELGLTVDGRAVLLGLDPGVSAASTSDRAMMAEVDAAAAWLSSTI
jgi:hypothetical protein